MQFRPCKFGRVHAQHEILVGQALRLAAAAFFAESAHAGHGLGGQTPAEISTHRLDHALDRRDRHGDAAGRQVAVVVQIAHVFGEGAIAQVAILAPAGELPKGVGVGAVRVRAGRRMDDVKEVRGEFAVVSQERGEG